MRPAEPLGRGQTADVYAVGEGRVRKLFHDGTATTVATREAENTRLAEAAGLPVPAVHDVLTVEGRPAIVFDRVDGRSMQARLLARPWTVRRAARRLAQLHAEIHATAPTGGRSLRDRWDAEIRAAPGRTPSTRQQVRSHLDRLPAGDRLCHGDFHPANVLVGDDGPVVIDWLDAGVGPPAADVARTNLLLRFAAIDGNPIQRAFVSLFRRLYLRASLARQPVSLELVRAWELPLAAARLNEGVPEEPSLRSFVTARLAETGPP